MISHLERRGRQQTNVWERDWTTLWSHGRLKERIIPQRPDSPESVINHIPQRFMRSKRQNYIFRKIGKSTDYYNIKNKEEGNGNYLWLRMSFAWIV